MSRRHRTETSESAFRTCLNSTDLQKKNYWLQLLASGLGFGLDSSGFLSEVFAPLTWTR
jgi:hypothetical protein